jgi:hypothetical protein
MQSPLQLQFKITLLFALGAAECQTALSRFQLLREPSSKKRSIKNQNRFEIQKMEKGVHQLIINQCTIEERNSEVRCNCTDILKTSAKLQVNKKEAKPEVEVGDQDAADGKVRGKYKGIFSKRKYNSCLLILFFFLV